MKKSVMITAPVAALLALGSYFSPHLALYQMKRAIDAKDAEAFSDYVDFPALRESFKGQMMVAMNRQMSSPQMQGNPFAGLGQALATAFIGPMVDTMISPAGVIAMMDTGKPSAAARAAIKVPPPSTTTPEQAQKPKYSISYKDWNRVVARVGSQGDDQMGFVLRRQGFWSWKLSAIEMPASFLK